MRERPVFHEELGRFFVQLRKDKGWGQRFAAELAERRKLAPLTRQVLLRLEKGQTKNPEPDVFRALAALYDVPYADLVGRFLTQRYGIAITTSDLPDHMAGVQHVLSPYAQPSPGGELDAATSSAFRELREITVAYKQFRQAVKGISDQLASLVSDAEGPEELRETPHQVPRRRRRR